MFLANKAIIFMESKFNLPYVEKFSFILIFFLLFQKRWLENSLDISILRMSYAVRDTLLTEYGILFLFRYFVTVSSTLLTSSRETLFTAIYIFKTIHLDDKCYQMPYIYLTVVRTTQCPFSWYTQYKYVVHTIFTFKWTYVIFCRYLHRNTIRRHYRQGRARYASISFDSVVISLLMIVRCENFFPPA